MKETYPKDQVPPAPPPPPLGPCRDETHDERIENEGGEAPMDMETREESLGLFHAFFWCLLIIIGQRINNVAV